MTSSSVSFFYHHQSHFKVCVMLNLSISVLFVNANVLTSLRKPLKGLVLRSIQTVLFMTKAVYKENVFFTVQEDSEKIMHSPFKLLVLFCTGLWAWR